MPAGLFQLLDRPFQCLLDQARCVQLQTFTGIPGGAPQLIVNLLQHKRAPPRPGLGQCAIERIKPQLESLGQHPQQARLRAPAIAPGNAQQRQQGVDTQTAFGRLTKDMQAVADLRFLQVAQVGIQARQPHRRVRLTAQFQLLVDTGFAHQLEDVFLQLLGTARVEQLRFVILIGQQLKVTQRAVGFGAGQRWHQVVDDHRLGAPLGLGALTRVVDDKRVDIRQRPQQCIRPAVLRQAHAFTRQPFQVAVLAHMDHAVGAVGMA